MTFIQSSILQRIENYIDNKHLIPSVQSVSLSVPVQFSAGIDVPQTVFIIVLILNSSLWLIPAGNSRSATVHEEPPQMRAPPPLMRDHPSWPVVELFMYNLVLGLCKISPNTGRSGEKDDVETC